MNANISYKLVDIDEILYTYDDSIIKLNNILTNCIKLKIIEEAQEFIAKLNEIVYITRLWADCQYKWLFLEKIYAMTNWNKDQSIYNQIVKDFRNFQFRVADNPIVLNVIARIENAKNLSLWHKQMVRYPNVSYFFLLIVLLRELINLDYILLSVLSVMPNSHYLII